MLPMPRPDVTAPPVGDFLLYAQVQRIGQVPLQGTTLLKDKAKTLLSVHVRGTSPSQGWGLHPH